MNKVDIESIQDELNNYFFKVTRRIFKKEIRGLENIEKEIVSSAKKLRTTLPKKDVYILQKNEMINNIETQINNTMPYLAAFIKEIKAENVEYREVKEKAQE